MAEKRIRRACPYLGLSGDPVSYFVEPDEGHRCFANKSSRDVSLEHQTQYCFAANFADCKRYVPLKDPNSASSIMTAKGVKPRKSASAAWRFLLGIAVVGPAILLVIAALLMFIPDIMTPHVVATVRAQVFRTVLPNSAPAPIANGSAPSAAPVTMFGFVPPQIPSLPTDGVVLTLSADSERTGWVSSTDATPHWREVSLPAGTFQNKPYASVIQFNLRDVQPGSRIAYLALDISGKDSSHIGKQGEWRIELLDARQQDAWSRSYDQVVKAPALAIIDQNLSASDIAVGRTNRFEFNGAMMNLVESQLEFGVLGLRITGPSSPEDDMFAWESGANNVPNPPTIYLAVVPPPTFIATNTPTPMNVLTAAAMAAQSTASAQRFGTPTPFRGVFVTATPQLELNAAAVVITAAPTPANSATAQNIRALATAVAMTTGTYTPTPNFWVTATPLPLEIPEASLTPEPTKTLGPTRYSTTELAKMALPSGLKNKIAFLEGPRENPRVWTVNPDGSNLSLLTDRMPYDIAKARDQISPDGTTLVYQDLDQNRVMQLWGKNLNFPNAPPTQLTFRNHGVVYGQAWSPDGKKVIYTSDELDSPELFVFTLEPKSWKRLTFVNLQDWFWNQFPSWSPNGSQIVYSSDRGLAGSRSEIWIMNADGSGMHKITDKPTDSYNPVWFKWDR